MFEKEAEELIEESKRFNTTPRETVYKAIEFGYNKANEWHYVKDGDLPLDDSFVLVWTEYGGITTNYGKEYSDGVPENGLFKGIHISDVIAWKEIVPPKED